MRRVNVVFRSEVRLLFLPIVHVYIIDAHYHVKRNLEIFSNHLVNNSLDVQNGFGSRPQGGEGRANCEPLTWPLHPCFFLGEQAEY